MVWFKAVKHRTGAYADELDNGLNPHADSDHERPIEPGEQRRLVFGDLIGKPCSEGAAVNH
jgi:hypothetical protein